MIIRYTTTPSFQDVEAVIDPEFRAANGWTPDDFETDEIFWVDVYRQMIQDDIIACLDSEYAGIGMEYSRIEGSSVNWAGQPGGKVIDNDDLLQKPLEVTAVTDSDHSQVWTFEDGKVTIRQSSHDIPRGALFTLTGTDSNE